MSSKEKINPPFPTPKDIVYPNLPTKFRDIPIVVLGLTVRARNCLRKEGISTLGELASIEIDYLCSTKNLGIKSLSLILEQVTQYVESNGTPPLQAFQRAENRDRDKEIFNFRMVEKMKVCVLVEKYGLSRQRIHIIVTREKFRQQQELARNIMSFEIKQSGSDLP